MMLFVQCNQDFTIGRSNSDIVTERKIDRVRHADVIGDDPELAGRNESTNEVFNALKVDFRFLDSCSGGDAHVESQLPGIDTWKKITAGEEIQRKRQQCETDEQEGNDNGVFERPIQRARVGCVESRETSFRRISDA